MVVGSTDGTNVTLGKDGSITSTGADNTKVEIADGMITTTGSDGKQVIIGNGTVTADAINVDGIGADTGTFNEKVEVGSGDNKVTIADGGVSAANGTFKDGLSLGGETVNKIDTGTKPITSEYANADKAMATVATINATVGNAAGLTGANLSPKGEDGNATVADHLSSLNDAIGDRIYEGANVLDSGEKLTESLTKLDNVVGKISKLSDENYKGLAKDAPDLTTAIEQVDAQVVQNMNNIGDMGNLTHNAISDKSNLADAMNSLATNVESGMGGKFDENGKWSAELTVPNKEDGSGFKPNYGSLTANKVTDALQNIMGNIGEGEVLGDKAVNGVSAGNTVNENLAALNNAMGDVSGLNKELKNLTNGTDELPTTVVAALNNIDATLGRVHGLADKLKNAGKYNGNLAEGTTVEQHLTALDASIGNRAQISNDKGSNGYTLSGTPTIATALTAVASNIGTAADLGKVINGVNSQNTVNKNIAALNAAIGDVSVLQQGVYVAEATNVTDAVMQLDANIYRLDYQVNDLNYKYKKLHHEFRAGMASMAAMSALLPNPRAHGDTSLSLGTGAYSGHGAVAVGGFHHITDNLMLNAGVAWGNSNDASYRMGVTYSW